MAEHLRGCCKIGVAVLPRLATPISQQPPGFLEKKMPFFALLVSVSLCCYASLVRAETLIDPTRPPAGFGKDQGADTVSGPVLQSVLISSTRRIAIISGKTLKVGDKFGDAQLVAINQNDVVLLHNEKSGKNREVLKLYPSLYKPASGSHTSNNVDSPAKGK